MRKHVLTFEMLVVFVLQMVGGRSLQVGLDQFFTMRAGGADFTRAVNSSALSQAPKTLKPSALCALWVGKWLAVAGEPLWLGQGVVAADGPCVHVPSWRETQHAYDASPSGDY